jgi:16S rRNA (cytosine967-C5)-methyltransferase
MTDSLQARRIALTALQKILREKFQADMTLEKTLDDGALDKRDRAFTMRLVMGTLRYIRVIDALLLDYVSSPLEAKGAGYVQDVLRLGTAQLLFLDVPPHAAVHSSVELVKDGRFKGLAKLTNGVLQSIQRTGREKLDALDVPRIGTPDWLWNRWSQDWGRETAEKIASWNMREPALDITVKSQPEAWAEKLGGVLLPTGTVRLANFGNVTQLEGFSEGAWWVQDAAAALPVKLFAPLKGKKVLDLCAAPGGKTAQLAAAGGIVTAVDRSHARLKRVSENLKRLQLEARIEAADIVNWQPQERYDAILLDAPCSATGTIRRHPDIALHKRENDIRELAAIQWNMLQRALKWLKPGGELVYSTCSLEKEEGEDHIEAVLKAYANVKLEPVKPEQVGGLAEIVTSEGYVRTHPYHMESQGGMDGFFAAKFVKNS